MKLKEMKEERQLGELVDKLLWDGSIQVDEAVRILGLNKSESEEFRREWRKTKKEVVEEYKRGINSSRFGNEEITDKVKKLLFNGDLTEKYIIKLELDGESVFEDELGTIYDLARTKDKFFYDLKLGCQTGEKKD